jgi:hypothetical protein
LMFAVFNFVVQSQNMMNLEYVSYMNLPCLQRLPKTVGRIMLQG